MKVKFLSTVEAAKSGRSWEIDRAQRAKTELDANDAAAVQTALISRVNAVYGALNVANGRREGVCRVFVRRGVDGRKLERTFELSLNFFALEILASAWSQVPGRETHGQCASGMHDSRSFDAIRNDRFGLVFVRYELDSLEYSDLATSVRKAL